MASLTDNPYKKFKKATKGAKLDGASVNALMKRKATVKKRKGIKTTGKFEGKSNTLGQGGRAAQLKSQGVPGGVIGNLARAAHAAPGQANFHKRKAVKRKGSKHKDGKSTINVGEEGDVEMKKAKKRKATKKRKGTTGMGGDVEDKSTHHKCKGAMCKNAEHSKKG